MRKLDTVIAAARANGEMFYYNGLPCAHGHVSKRYTSTRQCWECGQDRLRFLREKTAQKRAEKPLTARALAKLVGSTRYKTDIPCSRGHLAERLTINGACVECSKLLALSREDEESRDKRKNYRRINAENYRSHTRNRRAKIKKADGVHTPDDINLLWDQQIGRCAYCKTALCDGYHVDHIVALSKGGRNDRVNLQLTCQGCNLSKHNKSHDEFLKTFIVT